MVRKVPTLTAEQHTALQKKTVDDKNLMLKKYVAAEMAADN